MLLEEQSFRALLLLPSYQWSMLLGFQPRLLSYSWFSGERHLWCVHKLRLALGKEREGLALLGGRQGASAERTAQATAQPRAQPAQ